MENLDSNEVWLRLLEGSVTGLLLDDHRRLIYPHPRTRVKAKVHTVVEKPGWQIFFWHQQEEGSSSTDCPLLFAQDYGGSTTSCY